MSTNLLFGDVSRFYPLQAGVSGGVSHTADVPEITGFVINRKTRERQGVDTGFSALLTD